MNHPFFENKKLVLIYYGIWIVIAAVHILVLLNAYEMKFQSALLDSLVFNIMFSVFGIAVWYIVSFTRPGKYALLNQLINHVTAASIILVVWISAGNALMKSALSDPGYAVFFEKSITWHVISGLFFYSILTLIYYITIYYNNMKDHMIREARLNEIIRQVELENLRSQINPHFLFNSLNSISSLTLSSPEKAQSMIIMLSDFLRYSISNPENRYSVLRAEIENSKRYLDIEQVRFGNKLVQEYTIDETCMDMEIPAMILQPLYENAVKHGVYESAEPIRIITSGKRNDAFLIIEIRNNYDPDSRSRKGSGIGLKNISERLKLLYGSSDLLKTKKESTFVAEIYIPLKKK